MRINYEGLVDKLGPEPGIKMPPNKFPDSITDITPDNIPNPSIPPGKTDISFNLMMQVKNKLLDAYQQMKTNE